MRYSCNAACRLPWCSNAMPRLIVRGVVVGVQTHSFAIFRDGSIPITFVRKPIPQVDVRLLIAGVQTDRLAILRDRSVLIVFL